MEPAVRAINLTVADLEGVGEFYANLFSGSQLSAGVFAGIAYRALIGKDGEVQVCLFEAGEQNPLAPSFPTIMVDSVPQYLTGLDRLDARLVVPESACPCTGELFAICEDRAGGQFMVKQPISHKLQRKDPGAA